MKKTRYTMPIPDFDFHKRMLDRMHDLPLRDFEAEEHELRKKTRNDRLFHALITIGACILSFLLGKYLD